MMTIQIKNLFEVQDVVKWMGEDHLNQVVKWMAIDLSEVIDWNEDAGVNANSLPTPSHANAYDLDYWKEIASSTFVL